MRTERDIVVVGGQSRLGRAILRHVGGKARAVARVPSGLPAAVVVPSYHDIASAAFAGSRTVINCAGLVHGSTADLRRANVDLPLLLATRARDAGCARFVQISSFSVYGHAETVGASTPTVPVSDYGQTKLAADQALAALETASFRPVSLRIPILINDAATSKLASLVRVAWRTGLVPRTTPPVERAMLSYAGAAEAAAAIADDQVTASAVLAADPVHFTYELLAQQVEAVTGRRLRRIPIPRQVKGLLSLIHPALHASLFLSSRLPERDNVVRTLPTEAALPAILASIIRRVAYDGV